MKNQMSGVTSFWKTSLGEFNNNYEENWIILDSIVNIWYTVYVTESRMGGGLSALFLL